MLQQLFAPQLVFLYILVASTLFVHFRGRVRLRFTRQLTDHSTYLAPYNALMYAVLGGAEQAVIQVERFPELAKLQRELADDPRGGAAAVRRGHIRAAAKIQRLRLQLVLQARLEALLPEVVRRLRCRRRAALCPKTVALVQSIPTVHGAMFAMLPPGGKLGRASRSVRRLAALSPGPRHAELGRLPDLRRRRAVRWRDGEAVMFDETFIHWAENKTDVNRIILFCDVERPLKRLMTASTAGSARTSSKPARRRTSKASPSARSTSSTARSMKFTWPAAA